jgi:hypothetical protein
MGRCGLKTLQQPRGRHRDLVNRSMERGFIRLRRFVEPADFAHILQCRRANLIVGYRRIEVEEHFDVAAHDGQTLPRRDRSFILPQVTARGSATQNAVSARTAPHANALKSLRVLYEEFAYPPCDEPLIDAYGGRFEALYVILHPFVRVPDRLAWRATHQYPSEEQIFAAGEKVRWSDVSAETGLRGAAGLNHALLTSINAIYPEFGDFAARDRLRQFLEAGNVWMPNEGSFEPLLHSDFMYAFESAGKSSLIFVPEFPSVDPVQPFNLNRLKVHADAFPARGTVMPEDASFLFTVDWDSFFTLLYGPRKFVSDFVKGRRVEGFFANATTEHYWFNYAMGCATVTVSPEDWAIAQ